jgi:hypothetical protein
LVSSQISRKTLKNPYTHRSAIKDPDHFVGRVRETGEILSRMAEGESVSIVGPRWIGKTSFLFYLRHRARADEKDTGATHLYVFLDCQRRPKASQPAICEWIWSEMAECVRAVKKLPAAVGSRQELDEKLSAAVGSADEFESCVGGLCDAGFKITLLLDEFELLAANSELDTSFFTRLRGMSIAYPINYVTSSVRPLSDLRYSDRSVLASPFFSMFHPRRLGFLTPEEAEELIRKPVGEMEGFPPYIYDEIAFLFEVAGYNPAFLQIACYHLFEHKVKGHKWSEQVEREVRREYEDEAVGHFRYAWKQLTPSQQRAMVLICTDQADEVNDHLWTQLEQQCLVYEKKPFSSAFKEFVLNEGILDVVSEERISAPVHVRLRAFIRDLIRKYVLGELSAPGGQLPVVHRGGLSPTSEAQPVPPGVSVSLLTRVVPTSYCRYLKATAFPLVTVSLDNTGQGCANGDFRVNATIEDCSDVAVDCVHVSQGRHTYVRLLPLVKPAVAATLNVIRPATLHITVDQTAPIKRNVYDRTEPVQLHARDTALLAVKVPDGSTVDLTEYLAAWVTPRQREVERLLKQAAKYHPDGEFIGYHGASKPAEAVTIVRRQAQAVFTALKQDVGLTYISSALSFGEQPGQMTQRVRLPSDSLAAGGAANCIDGTVLFASLLEAASIEPFIVIVPEHAFVGWRIWPGVDLDYEFLEITMIGSVSFDAAQQLAKARYEDAKSKGYLTHALFDPGGYARLIDVAACRAKGIHPLE